MRLSAEKWLKENRQILFSHAAHLIADEDVLEKLVNSEHKPRYNNNSSRNNSMAAISPKVTSKEVTENLLDMDHHSATSGSGYRANSMGSASNKKAPPSKQFKEEFE